MESHRMVWVLTNSEKYSSPSCIFLMKRPNQMKTVTLKKWSDSTRIIEKTKPMFYQIVSSYLTRKFRVKSLNSVWRFARLFWHLTKTLTAMWLLRTLCSTLELILLFSMQILSNCSRSKTEMVRAGSISRTFHDGLETPFTSQMVSTSVTIQRLSIRRSMSTRNASSRSTQRKTSLSASRRTMRIWLTRLWRRYTISGRRCAMLSWPSIIAKMATLAWRT